MPGRLRLSVGDLVLSPAYGLDLFLLDGVRRLPDTLPMVEARIGERVRLRGDVEGFLRHPPREAAKDAGRINRCRV